MHMRMREPITFALCSSGIRCLIDIWRHYYRNSYSCTIVHNTYDLSLLIITYYSTSLMLNEKKNEFVFDFQFKEKKTVLLLTKTKPTFSLNIVRKITFIYDDTDGKINSVPTAGEDHDSISMSTNVVHSTSTSSTSIHLSSPMHTNDVACFLSNHKLKQSEIAKCLKLAWVPPPNFAFPEKIEGKQKRKFQYKYLTTFSWLAYSHLKEGAYCKLCILFAFSGGGIENQRLGKLVTEPMVKFKDAINEFKNHEKKEYHLMSVQRANDFLINFENDGSKAVDVLIDKRKQQVIESNQKRIVPIIKTILFCARSNLPLRGHRESGLLSSNEIRSSCFSGEQGVFRALLSFRVESGDTTLMNHFETSSKNCTMISSRIQNEIIVAVGDVIVGKIVERICLRTVTELLK
ncbi:hypothetical protein QTP88_010753 [Uroleucon formosanum]